MRIPFLPGPTPRGHAGRRERHVLSGRGYAPGSGQEGFTLIEVMTAFIIVGLAALGFFQVFAYGAVQLEKLGQRRQALGLLDGEMEFWRARFQAAQDGKPVAPAEADLRRREVKVGTDAGFAFAVDPDVSPVQRHRDLAYQTVQVRVTYGRADAADTLFLESRHYVP